MARPHRTAVPYRVLQEYLQALAESADEGPTERQQRLLHAYAELQYQIRGGSRCSACRASVRHVLPVRAEHTDGTIAEYLCLCARCLEAERVASERVVITVGQAQLEYTRTSARPKTRTYHASAR